MSGVIGTIGGTFTAPGVSKNRRHYTKEVIGKAVTRMQERLGNPGSRPITMLSHHGAEDDSTRIAGAVTKVWQAADGSARFTADIADTSAGRDIAALVTPDRPFLKSVSLRGWWLGDVRTENVDGVPCEVGDDMEIDGVDFTKSPGVELALIDSATLAETTEGLARSAITESVQEARVTIAETAETVTYADPGYKADGVKRYPLGDAAEIRKAWASVQTSEGYTPKQLKRMRGRIKTASEAAGINVIGESEALVASVTDALEEAWASMNVDNGQGDVRVSGYTADASQLPAMARRVAMAAMAGITVLDPDNDGDIDTDIADETSPAAPATEAAASTETEAAMAVQTTKAPEPPKPLAEMSPDELTAWAAKLQETPEPEGDKGATETTAEAEVKPEVPAVPSTETERHLTDADIAALAEALKPKPDTTPVAENGAEAPADAKVETTEEIEKRLRESILKEVGDVLGRAGFRKGLLKTTAETAPSKPLHEMSSEEFAEYRTQVLNDALPS
jgi:hypothetical protein